MKKIIDYLRKCRYAYHDYVQMRRFRHRVPEIMEHYQNVMTRIQEKYRNGEAIEVVFLVNDISKWKCQSLYDLMSADEHFHPYILITYVGNESDNPEECFEKKKTYFLRKKMEVLDSWSRTSKCFTPLCKFTPDIVFYPQPWGLHEDLYNNPEDVSRYALTCYVPYYVPNYGDCQIDVGSFFHRALWRYFALNEIWKNEFEKYLRRKEYAGEILGLGHPALDTLDMSSQDEGDFVIYAPHWSIDHPGNPNGANFSTFLKNGKHILEFARVHSEIKWAFKPHPVLRNALLKSGAMAADEIDDYYSAWEKIGEACYDADYSTLFAKSRAMVTDCASFLTEYACTGKPIIHLISPTRKIEPLYPNRELFNTYYQVRNEADLDDTLEKVVVLRKDEKKAERLAALKKTGLRGNSAGKKILEYLNVQLGKG